MRRVDLGLQGCPVAGSLALLGEWWTLLILRDAFAGVQRFDDFQKSMNIPRNTLSERLAKLVAHRIMAKVSTIGMKRKSYVLTEKGKDLLPLMLALRHFGLTHVSGVDADAWRLVDRRTGEEVHLQFQLVSAAGPVMPENVSVIRSRNG
jgi:DNA-binding HxlR family transcriptional regulator